MNDIITKIQEELRKGELNMNPHLCSEYVARLCAERSFAIAQQMEIEIDRSKNNWLELRKNYKSDTATLKAWELTPQGIDWKYYGAIIKMTTSLITGLKTLLAMHEAEQKNLQ